MTEACSRIVHVPKPCRADPQLGRRVLETTVSAAADALEALKGQTECCQKQAFAWVRSGGQGRLIY